MTSTASNWPASSRRRIDVDGSQLAYLDVGQGEVLLLLHGYPATASSWRHQISDLSRDYRVIAPDWFGFGESERRFDTRPDYDFEVSRVGRILDVLSIERSAVVGHDYGGYLALGFAARQPRRVSSLGVVNCRAHRTFPQPTYAQFQALCMLARTPVVRTLLGLAPFYSLNRLLLRDYARDGGPLADGTLREYLAWMKTPRGRRWVVHFFRHYAMAENVRLRSELGSIRSPTRIIWGADDPFCPTSIAEEVAELVPNSTVAILHGAGHFLPEEKPAEVSREIRVLLREASHHEATAPGRRVSAQGTPAYQERRDGQSDEPLQDEHA